MRSNNKGSLLAGVTLFLAACGGGSEAGLQTAPVPHGGEQGSIVADEPMMTGPAYVIGGRTYTPLDAANYDEVGYAGQYAPDGSTANGESFVPSGVSAAHQTLPLPSYVEVTSLDTGRTILVRINDRGPLANDRIIDLSPGAAEQLGIPAGMSAAVRVRRVSPPEQERAVLRAHGRAAERLKTPASLLAVLRQKLGRAPVGQKPLPKAVASRPAPPSARDKPGASFTPPPVERPRAAAPSAARRDGGFIVEQAGASTPDAPPAEPVEASAPRRPSGYIVQVAAFASQARAEALARKIGAGASAAGGVWRVRYGPYPTQDAAEQGVRTAAAKGYENAKIMANDAP